MYQSDTTSETQVAVFAVSLCHPVYIEVSCLNGKMFLGLKYAPGPLSRVSFMNTLHPLQRLKKLLQETFFTKTFIPDIVQPCRILESEVVLVVPEKTPEWEIRPNRLPTVVRLLFFSDSNVYIVQIIVVVISLSIAFKK